MNKPTRQEIEHIAIEKILNIGTARCINCRYYRGEDSYCDTEKNCIVALMETALEEAEKELTPPILTSNQQKILRGKLQALGEVTGHKYDTIQYIISFSGDKTIWLGYENHDGWRSEDKITGGTFIAFADQVFEVNGIYRIEDLLNG